MTREQLHPLLGRALLSTAQVALRGRPAPLPAWGAREHRVLFLRHDKIGDMVMSTGVLAAIAQSHPTIRLDVLASRSNAVVLERLGGLHDVLVLDGVSEGGSPRAVLRAARVLRARRYDAVVDGLVLCREVSSVTATLLAACGAPRRIGMAAHGGTPRGGVASYTHRVEPPADVRAHHVEHAARLAGPFGVAPEDVPRPVLRLSGAEVAEAEQIWTAAQRAQHGGAERGPRLLVNVSAGHWRRRWSDAQFAAAIRYAQQARSGTTVLVVGDPDERTAVGRIAADVGVAAPATAGVREAFALVARADGVLTPDTSIAHAASAFRTPCVTLMLPGAEPFAPYDTPGVLVVSATQAMTDVPVAAVTRALANLFGLLAGPVVGAGSAGSRRARALV